MVYGLHCRYMPEILPPCGYRRDVEYFLARDKRHQPRREQLSSMNSYVVLTLSAERPFVTVLSSNILTIDAPQIVSSYVMSFVGVYQLLHVR